MTPKTKSKRNEESNRLAMAYAADAFAMTCRNPSASPSDIARAERILSDRYAEYGSLILQTRAGVE